ncbi:Z1 domain-containing protein [Actinomyces sp.]|uniref:Z1 domain-containing protein n=1 Tax=Actinomyces sp. TaxID=29317 RepID=UPI0026DAE6F3|nr:Z1 domain-containing protein [Actinomyces sp.]MDO4900909.1 Z1 domain-containing protein [Actinomyces sp.]
MSVDQYDKALEQALTGMDDPMDLHPIVSVFLAPTGETIAREEVPGLILDADRNAPGRRKFHIRLGEWDAEKDAVWTDGTVERTSERRALIMRLLGISDDAAERIREAFPVFADRTTVIAAPDWTPWYDEERRGAHHFYWDGYRSLLESRLPAESVADIDAATTDIVGRLADPSGSEPYQSKGLVVGHVQSGKTANFTGVIAKAIDAGYRLIIVLTGTVEILRSQTQRRLDMELIGRENILGGIDEQDEDLLADVDYVSTDDADWRAGRFVSYGAGFTNAGVPAIRRLTGAKDDYEMLRAGLDALDPRAGHELSDPTRPMWHPDNIHRTDVRIAVVKKNKTVLTKLVNDLRRIKARTVEIPTLIIDDEADQASVNTVNPKKSGQAQRTAINRLIAELMRRLRRAQYVGYTATPFANVFISPEDAEDIFPRDFIVSLSAPKEYRGGRAYHDFEQLTSEEKKNPAVSNECAFVRDLRGDDDVDPKQVDEELLSALDAFVLTGAIKLWRAEARAELAGSFRHHTMLVHESVKQAEHAELGDRIRRLWRRAGYGSPASMNRLRSLFDEDFAVVSASRQWEEDLPQPDSFDAVGPFIGEVLDLVMAGGADPVVIVNGDKDQQYNQVDFQRDRVWRILVGGTKLSRGFTLEGLTVTYFKRRAAQADALMQMGRWFGYRPGYSDLVRLYMAREIKGPRGAVYDLYDAFGAIMQDEEQFRDQLATFARIKEDGRPAVKPIDVPPLVFQQLPWLRPTGRNKMYNAKLDFSGIGGVLQDFPRQPDRGDGGTNKRHFELVRPWFERDLFGPVEEFEYRDPSGNRRRTFKGRVAVVPAEEMLSVLDGFEWVEKFDFTPTLEMIRRAMAEERLKDWAVLLPLLEGTPEKTVDGLRIPMLRRTRRPDRGGFSGSSFRQRDAIETIAGKPDATGEHSPGGDAALAYRTRTRGAMLLTFAADPKGRAERTPSRMPEEMAAADTATIFSLALPYEAAPKGRIAFSVRRRDRSDDPVVDAD